MNRDRLRAAMALVRMSVDKACEILHISRSSWYRKVTGKSEFTRWEIETLARALQLDESGLMSVFYESFVSFKRQEEV